MSLDRREFLRLGAAGLSSVALRGAWGQEEKAFTRFQVGCTTLPYGNFPLDRALKGIQSAGFKYVALYTHHKEDGKSVPVIAPDDPPERAKEVGQKCRDLGLEPAFMFSGIYPEAKNGLEVLTQRLKQAAAGKIGQVLTFGHTKGGARALWIERFRQLGPIARDLGVLLVVKQHGGETGTGAACAEITREVADEGVKVNFDAGNVLDYLNVDPIPDLKVCADQVRSFCIKDHRNFPKSQDCGPGLGEIDHYKLLHVVARTGLAMPLCCENIFAPLVERPKDAEGVDALARRAREFLETVVTGLQR
jgi:sugar phosphate isomerase/epimerase